MHGSCRVAFNLAPSFSLFHPGGEIFFLSASWEFPINNLALHSKHYLFLTQSLNRCSLPDVLRFETSNGAEQERRILHSTAHTAYYWDFQYHASSEIQTSTKGLYFSLPSIIKADLSGNRSSLQSGHVCWSWLVDFDPFCFFSVFPGSLAVAIILIDGREKPNRQLGFELQSSYVIKNRNNLALTLSA